MLNQQPNLQAVQNNLSNHCNPWKKLSFFLMFCLTLFLFLQIKDRYFVPKDNQKLSQPNQEEMQEQFSDNFVMSENLTEKIPTSLLTVDEAMDELVKIQFPDSNPISAVEEYLASIDQVKQVYYLSTQSNDILIFEDGTKKIDPITQDFIKKHLIVNTNGATVTIKGINGMSCEAEIDEFSPSLSEFIFTDTLILSSCSQLYLFNNMSLEKITVTDPSYLLPNSSGGTIDQQFLVGNIELFEIAGYTMIRISGNVAFRTHEVVISAKTGEVIGYLDFKPWHQLMSDRERNSK